MTTEKEQVVVYLIKMRDKQELFSDLWWDYNEKLMDIVCPYTTKEKQDEKI